MKGKEIIVTFSEPWYGGNSTGIDRRITGDETLITDHISITKT